MNCVGGKYCKCLADQKNQLFIITWNTVSLLIGSPINEAKTHSKYFGHIMQKQHSLEKALMLKNKKTRPSENQSDQVPSLMNQGPYKYSKMQLLTDNPDKMRSTGSHAHTQNQK